MSEIPPRVPPGDHCCAAETKIFSNAVVVVVDVVVVSTLTRQSIIPRPRTVQGKDLKQRLTFQKITHIVYIRWDKM